MVKSRSHQPKDFILLSPALCCLVSSGRWLSQGSYPGRLCTRMVFLTTPLDCPPKWVTTSRWVEWVEWCTSRLVKIPGYLCVLCQRLPSTSWTFSTWIQFHPTSLKWLLVSDLFSCSLWPSYRRSCSCFPPLLVFAIYLSSCWSSNLVNSSESLIHVLR